MIEQDTIKSLFGLVGGTYGPGYPDGTLTTILFTTFTVVVELFVAVAVEGELLTKFALTEVEAELVFVFVGLLVIVFVLVLVFIGFEDELEFE